MYLFLTIILIISLIVFIMIRKNRNHCVRGRHVVVTGGSSGIGRCVAIEAARRGANVTLIARDVGKLEEAKADVTASCADKEKQLIRCLSLDVCSSDEDFNNQMELIERDLGSIHMLVNCAGTSMCGKLEDMKTEDVKRMMDVNFFGTYYPTKAVIPSMKKRNEGIIVLVGSQASLLGIFGFAAYSSSKFALRGLAEALHMEVSAYNISVTLALPPDTDTPGFANEEKTKLMETRLISESAGLVKPEVVATQLMDDALAGKFYSVVGFESYMLSTMCAGMTPYSSVWELIGQVTLMGLFRLIGQFYLCSFHSIIKRCMKMKDSLKKGE